VHQPCHLRLSGFGTVTRTSLVKVPRLANTGIELGWARKEEVSMRKGVCPAVTLIFMPLLLGQAAVLAQPQSSGSRTFMTGAKLVELCKTENPYCTGYVAGVADTLAPLSEPGGPLPPSSLASFCPGQMTVKQAIAAFQKYAQANPEGLGINAAQFAGDALHEAYPCTRK